jgi:hypothetical protein
MGDQGMFACIAPEQYGGLGLEEGNMAATLMAIEVARVAFMGIAINLQMNGPRMSLLNTAVKNLKKGICQDSSLVQVVGALPLQSQLKVLMWQVWVQQQQRWMTVYIKRHKDMDIRGTLCGLWCSLCNDRQVCKA